MLPAKRDHRIGQVLDGVYRVDRRIGQGAMGAVYEATHLRLPRRLAIKFLHPVWAARRDLCERFRREAYIASQIDHDSMVEVFDLNTGSDGVPYMVLELLQGEDLAARLERVGRLSLGEVTSLLFQISGALEMAHASGVIHRDLKPSNVYLARRGNIEVVKVLDFGVSKLLGSNSVVTMAGSIVGTANYMAPEQALGQTAIDPRADVFALGTILYECLAGHKAFPGNTLYETYDRLVNGTPMPLPHWVPAPVAGVLWRALARDPQHRQAGAAVLRDEMMAACRAPLGTDPGTSGTRTGPAETLPRRWWTWLQRGSRR